MGKIMKALNLFKRKGSKTTSRSENPGLSNLRTQSYILKENRRQGYPLGDLPSAASEISKATTKYGGQGIILKKGVPTKSVGKSIAQWHVKQGKKQGFYPLRARDKQVGKIFDSQRKKKG